MVIVVSFIGVGDMRVNLRGSDGAMPKKALNEANIRSVFQFNINRLWRFRVKESQELSKCVGVGLLVI